MTNVTGIWMKKGWFGWWYVMYEVEYAISGFSDIVMAKFRSETDAADYCAAMKRLYWLKERVESEV